MREFQHTVTTPDGVRLFVREYLPDVVAPRRSLLFLHGVCEHGGRYAEFAQAATAAGWRVLIPDHRGHGRATGVRVFVRRFDEYLADVRQVCQHFSLDPQRTAVVGHSMGGLIAARLLETDKPLVAAGCLLSPYLGLRIKVDRGTLFLGRMLAVIWPWYRFRSRVRAADLSRDDDYLERRREDPLIERTVTAGWFFAVQQALQEVHDAVGGVRTPMLILQGEQDHIVDPAATKKWCESLTNADRTLELLPGHLHELLQEPDRRDTVQRILNWLDERVPVEGDRPA